jgi:hypothetical protein
MNPWPISPIAQKDLDFSVVNYDFTTFTAGQLAELPGLENAIDLTILDLAASVADQTVLIGTLFDGLDDLATMTGEIDNSPLDGVLGELANTATASDAILSDYQGMLTGTSSGGGGGGGGGTTPTQSAKCGTHGDSAIKLSDDTGNCYAADVTHVLDIADGTCFKTCIMDGSCFAGRTGVRSASLLSGDAKLFSVSVDTVTPQGSNAAVSRVTFTLTPYTTGHFLAKFTVHTDRNPNGEIWCLIADVIDSGTSGGGGAGGGGGGGRRIGGTP